jgi:hypothetical protein
VTAEPEYIYVKGSGWVVNYTPWAVLDGRLRFEIRKPELNERYLYIDRYGDRRFNVDPAILLQNLVTKYRGVPYENFNQRLSPEHVFLPEIKYVYVTVVPV